MSRARRTVLALAAGTVLTVLAVVVPAASAQAAPAGSIGGFVCGAGQGTLDFVGLHPGGTCPQ
ncbi:MULTISPECIES: hypothetical protein [Streptomyces]|uniref:Uncharacterized protein n=1 Tax=Streptomyces morookaense TaxID=1970 RepID=A0A7Y7B7K2_STRMO|nr:MULTISPECIES: hypothetical protein [Streptomyces]MCC2280517.1 hypothetical protein [Streptomyces sp. ET3-23]NVK80289.1 hypothetical protein [Streptomyces morookaense]GHF39929.1 hypothetical protein GCM10010359_48120 [Streptomyces morookaense]